MNIDPYSNFLAHLNPILAFFIFAAVFVLVFFFSILLASTQWAKDPDYKKEGYYLLKAYFISIASTGLIVLVVWLSASWASGRWTRPPYKEAQPERLVFTGKVVNEITEEWPNDRLVLLFLKNKEIARTTTQLMEVSINEQGPVDGTFVIQTANDYKLSMQDVNTDVHPDLQVGIGRSTETIQATGLFGRSTTKEADYTLLYYWINEMEEGEAYSINIPSKNAEYRILVLEGNATDLPSAIQAGSLELRDDGVLVAASIDVPYQEALGNANVTEISFASDPEIVELKEIVVPIDNCGGSAKVDYGQTFSQTFVHEYSGELGGSLGGEIPLAAWFSLIAKLEATYGFKQGEVNSETISYSLAAEPLTNQVYTITWKEVWQSGSAEVATENRSVVIPFRAKTSLITDIKSEKHECN